MFYPATRDMIALSMLSFIILLCFAAELCDHCASIVQSSESTNLHLRGIVRRYSHAASACADHFGWVPSRLSGLALRLRNSGLTSAQSLMAIWTHTDGGRRGVARLATRQVRCVQHVLSAHSRVPVLVRVCVCALRCVARARGGGRGHRSGRGH